MACIIYIVVGISDDTLKFVLVAASLVTGVFAVRFSVSFDVNRYREEKREQRRHYAKSLCPHVKLVSGDVLGNGEVAMVYRGAYVKPPGTDQWQCQMCGHVTYGEFVEENETRWKKSPDRLLDRLMEFQAAAKKVGD